MFFVQNITSFPFATRNLGSFELNKRATLGFSGGFSCTVNTPAPLSIWGGVVFFFFEMRFFFVETKSLQLQLGGR